MYFSFLTNKGIFPMSNRDVETAQLIDRHKDALRSVIGHAGALHSAAEREAALATEILRRDPLADALRSVIGHAGALHSAAEREAALATEILRRDPLAEVMR